MRMDFYHLQKSPMEKALPQLLSKVYSTGMHALVLASSAEKVEEVNSLLWTFNDAAWLPHGSKKDGNAEQQSIWITEDSGKNPNNAEVLVLVDGAIVDVNDEVALKGYSRCLNVFDGNDTESLTAARAYWKQVKAKEFELHYWQQTDRGGWEEKA
ncbi:MAG: DNA polymerase III subunit chi [Alphaproteobacteria bacterium]|nr:DNA polymerase III subunit chi [Alphaproteobacteria bacterium]